MIIIMFVALRGRECEPRPTANVTGGCRAYLLHASNTLVGLSLITWNVSGFIRKYTELAVVRNDVLLIVLLMCSVSSIAMGLLLLIFHCDYSKLCYIITKADMLIATAA